MRLQTTTEKQTYFSFGMLKIWIKLHTIENKKIVKSAATFLWLSFAWNRCQCVDKEKHKNVREKKTNENESLKFLTWTKAAKRSTGICIGNLFVRVNAAIVPFWHLVYVWRHSWVAKKNYHWWERLSIFACTSRRRKKHDFICNSILLAVCKNHLEHLFKCLMVHFCYIVFLHFLFLSLVLFYSFSLHFCVA